MSWIVWFLTKFDILLGLLKRKSQMLSKLTLPRVWALSVPYSSALLAQTAVVPNSDAE